MPPTPSSTVAIGWSRLTGVILPITIVGAILVLIVPVPTAVLDLLLSANVTLAVIILGPSILTTPQSSQSSKGFEKRRLLPSLI